MKIEKAMEELSKLKHYVDCQPSEFNENTWDAIEEAETALQEKQEREHPQPLSLDKKKESG